MKIERVWAMPNKWTFTIKPIKQLLDKYVGSGMLINGLWCDPFAGENSPAQETNDLNPDRPTKYHFDAIDFLKQFPDDYFDGVLYDPPYSVRQVAECYKGVGKNVTSEMTRMNFYSDSKNEVARIIKPGGIAICFGWTSMGLGIGRGYEMEEVLLVPHGGTKNDTIVTVERRTHAQKRN